jgi:crossover junction endodeoxyribonuclease RuvC
MYIGVDASLTGTALIEISADGKVINDIHGLGYSLPEDADHWMLARRTSIIATGIINFIADRPRAAIEGYSFSSTGQRMLQLAELGGAVRDRITELNWSNKPKIIPPTSLKKFACGKGNADKAKVAVGVWKNWQFEHDDDNVIDAYVLAQMMRHSHLPLPMTSYQRDTLNTLILQ